MKLELVDQSIVVVAERHNPSILHPSFLLAQGIIPNGIELTEPPICLPDMAIASFDNGLRINVDNIRLQFTNNQVSANNFSLSSVAEKYVQELPHVAYKSVGCNTFSFIENDNAEQYLLDKFVNTAECSKGDFPLESSGVRLVYRVPEGLLNVSFDAGNLNKIGELDKKGILVRGNYHVNTEGFIDTLAAIKCFDRHIALIMSHLEGLINE